MRMVALVVMAQALFPLVAPVTEVVCLFLQAACRRLGLGLLQRDCYFEVPM